ncbi:Vacuolar protein sorting-associated protein 52 [Massospora cicadina]|nr:Vacuolar protein sorting-associated protein 52 [Massospora cicadina]
MSNPIESGSQGGIDPLDRDQLVELFDGELLLDEIDGKGYDCEALYQLPSGCNELQNDLVRAEEAAIDDVNEHLPKISELSQQIEQCDGVLAGMEEVLGGFRGRLAELNRDISEIQAQSCEMQARLARRLEVHKLLTRTIDQLAITPENIKVLLQGRVDEEYTASLLALQKNLKFTRSEAGRKLPAFKQMALEHDKLRLKTAATIRHFFLHQLGSLGSIKEGELADLHRLQREVLLPNKTLYHIVIAQHPGVAAEIAQYYANYSTAYHLQKFRCYFTNLLRRQLVVGDKADLIGNDDTQKKALLDFSIFGGTMTLKDKHNLLSLGERGLVLEFPESYTPLSAHGVTKHPFEELFKSFNYVFSVSLAQEHCFLHQFLAVKEKELPAELHPEQMFQDIFCQVFKYVHKSCVQHAESSYDAIGILLCIRLNAQFAAELRNQLAATKLDVDYFQVTDRIFWPRFQHLLNAHIDSLKSRSSRYAEMAASILVLADGHDEPMLLTSLSRLKSDFLLALGKMKDKIPNSRQGHVFLLNNYDLIQGVLSGHPPKAVEGEMSHFKRLHASVLEDYINEELVHRFGEIVTLSEGPDVAPSAAHGSQLVSQFNQTYRANLANLNASVLRQFPNLQLATSVLHTLLAHLMLVYSKFLSSLDSRSNGKPPLSVVPLSLHQLKAEVKKYRSNF